MDKKEDKIKKLENNQLQNVSGGSEIRKLDDSDLSKVAGGFEMTVPFSEFLESKKYVDKNLIDKHLN